MDLTYLILAAAIVGCQLLYTGVLFLHYRQAAQRSGLPYTWSLVHELQGPAFITDAILRWWYRDYLEQGKGWPRWARFMIKDWHYEDRRRATLEYGDYFLVVTPNGLICYISDPGTAGGHDAEWGEGKSPDNVPAGHKSSLVGALTDVIMHLPHILLLPRWFLGEEREKLLYNNSDSSRENLLTAVIRPNMDAEKKADALIGRSRFTDEEIKGNVFIFLVAGYDTTANTVQFSSLVLAFHQDVQERVLDEIDAAYAQAKNEGRSELSYEHDYPRFRYLFAFMYEVMRAFPIVQTLAQVAVGGQGVPMDKGSAIVPAGTRLVVNNTAIHYDPDILAQSRRDRAAALAG
ncbi:cytochrome P450 [Jackrogersella minutella]|nr:cytochrome P450 [Jackrogersella minutella]